MASDKVTLMVVRCCICAKERVRGEWIEPPEPADLDADEEEPRRIAVSHSYCPECVEAVREELAELLAS